MGKLTASQYQKKLKGFIGFIEYEYEHSVDILIEKLKKHLIDGCDALQDMLVFWLIEEHSLHLVSKIG